MVTTGDDSLDNVLNIMILGSIGGLFVYCFLYFDKTSLGDFARFTLWGCIGFVILTIALCLYYSDRYYKENAEKIRKEQELARLEEEKAEATREYEKLRQAREKLQEKARREEYEKNLANQVLQAKKQLEEEESRLETEKQRLKELGNKPNNKKPNHVPTRFESLEILDNTETIKKTDGS